MKLQGNRRQLNMWVEPALYEAIEREAQGQPVGRVAAMLLRERFGLSAPERLRPPPRQENPKAELARQLRWMTTLTLPEIAGRLGVSRSTVCRWLA